VTQSQSWLGASFFCQGGLCVKHFWATRYPGKSEYRLGLYYLVNDDTTKQKFHLVAYVFSEFKFLKFGFQIHVKKKKSVQNHSKKILQISCWRIIQDVELWIRWCYFFFSKKILYKFY
jgi:hypothetical protein